MFGLFKKRIEQKERKQVSIADKISYILNRGETGLHINIYVDDQILFQVVPAKDYAEKGVNGEELNDFIEIHFFNKNKTLTIENEKLVKELEQKGLLTHFEEPKNVNNYFNIVGKNPDKIQEIINNRIKSIYSNISEHRISIEYVCY